MRRRAGHPFRTWPHAGLHQTNLMESQGPSKLTGLRAAGGDAGRTPGPAAVFVGG